MEKIRKQFIIVKSLVVNSKGEILFVKRKKEELKQAHNKWEFMSFIRWTYESYLLIFSPSFFNTNPRF